MRTGKRYSLSTMYFTYAPLWVVHILAGDSRYSLEQAYDIDIMFGDIVKRLLLYYTMKQEDLEQLANSNLATSIVLAKEIAIYKATIDYLANSIKDYNTGYLDPDELNDIYLATTVQGIKTIAAAEKDAEAKGLLFTDNPDYYNALAAGEKIREQSRTLINDWEASITNVEEEVEKFVWYEDNDLFPDVDSLTNFGDSIF